MNRSSCLFLIQIAFAIALLAALLMGRPAAGQEMHHAGLIVRHGDGRLTYAYIAFPEDTISGLELLKRSGIPLVTVSFGGLGEGVCSLESEGCPASECRQRVCQGPGDESPYWRYFRQKTPGDWEALALGVSSVKVHDGDIDGWSWTPKDANLPAASMDDVKAVVGVTAESGAGESEPTAVVKTIYPEGVSPPKTSNRQSAIIYSGAALVLVGMFGAATLVIRRSRSARGSQA